jgi:phosphoribosylformylglycinamidine synthase subunit PurQ / glutaminase
MGAMTKPKVLVLRSAGINRDGDAVQAWEHVGAEAHLKHVNEVVGNDRLLDEYQILNVPGGFSYADDLGAGKLMANDLIYRLRAPFMRFVEQGKPVLGMCNGFQVLVKAGLFGEGITLARNENNKFECRWVRLKGANGKSLFTRGIETMYVPVAHGEGRFVAASSEIIGDLEQNGQVALRYCAVDGSPATSYPDNPNGSINNIAGICNTTGTVFGLMPHPENHIFPHNHPQWTRLKTRPSEGDGAKIFRNAVEYVQHG